LNCEVKGSKKKKKEKKKRMVIKYQGAGLEKEREKTGFTNTRRSGVSRASIFVVLYPSEV